MPAGRTYENTSAGMRSLPDAACLLQRCLFYLNFRDRKQYNRVRALFSTLLFLPVLFYHIYCIFSFHSQHGTP